VVQRRRVQVDGQLAVTALRVVDGLVGDLTQVVLGEGLKLEDAAAADEGLVDFKIGIFGGRANQDDGAVFDVG